MLENGDTVKGKLAELTKTYRKTSSTECVPNLQRVGKKCDNELNICNTNYINMMQEVGQFFSFHITSRSGTKTKVQGNNLIC